MRMHTEEAEHRQPSTTAEHPMSQQDTPEEQSQRASSPPADSVSSAADAMLRLSMPLHNQHQDMDAMTTTSGGYDSDDSASRQQQGSRQSRKQRQFIPEFKKDDQYWSKRKKNNEAAKRSREKRRINDIQMGQQILELTQKNDRLQKELDALKRKFGLPVDVVFTEESNGIHEGSSPSPKHSPSPHREQKVPAIIPTTIAQKLMETKSYSAHMPTLTNALLMPTSATTPVSRPTTTKPSVIFNTRGATCTPPLMPMNTLFSKEASQDVLPFSKFMPQVATFPLASQQSSEETIPVIQPRSPGSGTSSPAPCMKSEVSDSTQNEESSGEDSHSDRKRSHSAMADEAPLNLCKKEEALPEQKQSNSSGRRKQTRKGMPLKLWHKTYSDDQEMSEDNSLNEPFSVQDIKQEAVEEEEVHHEDGSPVEKRQRNNQSAKRCRINRKAVTELRLVQSSILENENSQLKTELSGLTQEISNLKDLLKQKQEAEARGEIFHPPPLEDLVPPTDKTGTESW